MSDDGLAANNAKQPPAPKPYSCTHCGGMGWPMPVLDTRQGRAFRLIRCFTCQKLDWSEEE
jgi:hypothetical protein